MLTGIRGRTTAMGEIADMMIEGDLCAECGSALECEGFGIPILCHDCHSDYQKKCNVPHEGNDGGYMCERYYK
jgi:hypothetical protein